MKLPSLYVCFGFLLYSSADDDFTTCFPEGGPELYKGQVSQTKSGYACQSWRAQSPWTHKVGTRPEDFKDGDGVMPDNVCRQPVNDNEAVPWCYTTQPGKRWEHCDIPVCQAVLVTKDDAPLISSEHVYTDGEEKLRILKQLRSKWLDPDSEKKETDEEHYKINDCAKVNFREHCTETCPFKDEYRIKPCICKQFPKAYCVEDRCMIDEGQDEFERAEAANEPCAQRWLDVDTDEEVTGLCSKPEEWDCDLEEVHLLKLDDEVDPLKEIFEHVGEE